MILNSDDLRNKQASKQTRQSRNDMKIESGNLMVSSATHVPGRKSPAYSECQILHVWSRNSSDLVFLGGCYGINGKKCRCKRFDNRKSHLLWKHYCHFLQTDYLASWFIILTTGQALYRNLHPIFGVETPAVCPLSAAVLQCRSVTRGELAPGPAEQLVVQGPGALETASAHNPSHRWPMEVKNKIQGVGV